VDIALYQAIAYTTRDRCRRVPRSTNMERYPLASSQAEGHGFEPRLPLRLDPHLIGALSAWPLPLPELKLTSAVP
jgi:hypothetical protein